MKANFDFNRLSESRKQELDRMVADFSEAGCLFVEDLFLEFLVDADNGIDRSDDKLVATFDDECGHELVFMLYLPQTVRKGRVFAPKVHQWVT